jgi:hypothetical protein
MERWHGRAGSRRRFASERFACSIAGKIGCSAEALRIWVRPAVLARVTNPDALGAAQHPWVVWPLHPDGSQGPGVYVATFQEGMAKLAEQRSA